MTFIWTFGFCKICLTSWYLQLETKKKLCFFCTCFFSYHFILKFFHKCDSSNYILVFIHVKKTSWALQCQMCGTYFKKNWRITEHLQKKKAWTFSWYPVEDINISDIFYQIQNFLRASWASIITTNGINFLMAGPLKNRNKRRKHRYEDSLRLKPNPKTLSKTAKMVSILHNRSS